MTPQPFSQWDVKFNDAVELGYEDVQAGLDALETLHHRLKNLSRRELSAHSGRLRFLRERTAREIAKLLSIQGNYQQALDLLEAEQGGAEDEDTIVPDSAIAYLLHNLGRSREAAQLIFEKISTADEPSFLVVPPNFFKILQFRQFDLARAFLDARRDPATALAEWLAPRGVSMLYRLEAQLFLEQGQHERVIVAYDKAVRADKGKNVYPTGLSEDLIMAGRPNLGLRLLRQSGDDEHVPLWTAIALRLLGKTDEANTIFEKMYDKPMPADEFHLQAWALAACYAGRADEGLYQQLDDYIAEGAEFFDVLHYTFGVVAGVLGFGERAGTAFEKAVLETRRELDGHLLNRQHWFHVQRLFTPAMQEAVARYFDPNLMPERYL